MTDEARVRAATALRALGHELVGRDAPEDVLDDLAASAERLRERLRASAPRVRGFSDGSFDDFRSRIPELGSGEGRFLWADSVVSGGANPMGLGAFLWRDGDHAVMRVTLGRAFEGAPGRAHGGVVAALLDETIGLAMTLQGLLALTATLDLRYLGATPIETPIESRAWVESRDGRKLNMAATLSADGQTVVEATGLFIAVDPTRFRPGA